MWRLFVRQVFSQASIDEALQELPQRLGLAAQAFECRLLLQDHLIELVVGGLLKCQLLLELDHSSGKIFCFSR